MADPFQKLGTSAVNVLARLAARNVVKAQLQGQGVRVSHVPQAVIIAQANDYLDVHPELYQQALERAMAKGWIEPAALRSASAMSARSAYAGISNRCHLLRLSLMSFVKKKGPIDGPFCFERLLRSTVLVALASLLRRSVVRTATGHSLPRQ
jgi:hypothetical protein